KKKQINIQININFQINNNKSHLQKRSKINIKLTLPIQGQNQLHSLKLKINFCQIVIKTQNLRIKRERELFIADQLITSEQESKEGNCYLKYSNTIKKYQIKPQLSYLNSKKKHKDFKQITILTLFQIKTNINRI
ncbi:hypothetical protein ABPG73_003322, partial [Tetrahymena malaccensis]